MLVNKKQNKQNLNAFDRNSLFVWASELKRFWVNFITAFFTDISAGTHFQVSVAELCFSFHRMQTSESRLASESLSDESQTRIGNWHVQTRLKQSH